MKSIAIGALDIDNIDFTELFEDYELSIFHQLLIDIHADTYMHASMFSLVETFTSATLNAFTERSTDDFIDETLLDPNFNFIDE